MAVERSHGTRRPRRPVPLALAVLGLLGLVALAARTQLPGRSGGNSGATRHVPSDLILEYILLLLLAEAVIVVPFVAYAYWTGRHERAKKRVGENWMKRLFIVMVAASVIFAALGTWKSVHDRGTGGSHARPPGTKLRPPKDGSTAHQVAPAFDWVPVVVVGSLLVLGILAALYAMRQSKRARPKSKEELAHELSHVLDDSLDDLRAEPDPRRAVIAAYARMERSLAWFGLPRKVFEAPLEYLSRVLIELKASTESVRRLTDLFERAKFSTQTVAPGLKDDAIEALVTVRDELRSYR